MRPVKVDTTLPPGICLNCGAPPSSREYFMDLGVTQFDYYGVLYYCNVCIKDLVLATGNYITREELAEHLVEKNIEINELGRQVAEVELVKDSLTALGFDVNRLLRMELERGRTDLSGVSDVSELSVDPATYRDESVSFEYPRTKFNLD